MESAFSFLQPNCHLYQQWNLFIYWYGICYGIYMTKSAITSRYCYLRKIPSQNYDISFNRLRFRIHRPLWQFSVGTSMHQDIYCFIVSLQSLNRCGTRQRGSIFISMNEKGVTSRETIYHYLYTFLQNIAFLCNKTSLIIQPSKK